MDLVRTHQVRKLMALFDEAGDVREDRARRFHLVSGIHRILGAAKVDLLVDSGFRPGALPRVEDLISSFGGSVGPAERACQQMSQNGCRANPAWRMLSERKAQAAYVVRRRAVLGDRDWYRSEFFNEHQRAHGLDDQLYSVRPLGHGRVEGIGVTREVSDPPFSDEDQNLLELFHEQLALRDRARRQPEDGPRLTPRESDVLRCLLAGAAEKAVAADLGISPQTVHTHVKSIYSAYGVSSRAELLAHCLTAPGGHTSA